MKENGRNSRIYAAPKTQQQRSRQPIREESRKEGGASLPVRKNDARTTYKLKKNYKLNKKRAKT